MKRTKVRSIVPNTERHHFTEGSEFNSQIKVRRTQGFQRRKNIILFIQFFGAKAVLESK